MISASAGAARRFSKPTRRPEKPTIRPSLFIQAARTRKKTTHRMIGKYRGSMPSELPARFTAAPPSPFGVRSTPSCRTGRHASARPVVSWNNTEARARFLLPHSVFRAAKVGEAPVRARFHRTPESNARASPSVASRESPQSWRLRGVIKKPRGSLPETTRALDRLGRTPLARTQRTLESDTPD